MGLLSLALGGLPPASQDELAGAVRPIRTLIEVYACPVCRMAQLYGTATERYEAAQKCCLPKVCETCGKGIPKNGYCRDCSSAAWNAKQRAKWDKAEIVDVKTLDKYMISAGEEFFDDLHCYLDHCYCEGTIPGEDFPFIALWRVAHVPDLSNGTEDDLPEDHDFAGDFDELEALIAKEFEDRRIGAFFPVDKRPVLPTPEEWDANLAGQEEGK